MQTAGNRVVLVRQETSPDDIHGMNAALGFLTARGGMTSMRPWWPARWGRFVWRVVKPSRWWTIKPYGSGRRRSVKAISLRQRLDRQCVRRRYSRGGIEVIQVLQGRGHGFREISIVPIRAEVGGRGAQAQGPGECRCAGSGPYRAGFGAEGIGLCRTEHMFFAEDRIQIMQKMILARKREEREMYLDQLLPLQKQDFIGLYREMKGSPLRFDYSIRRCTVSAEA